MLNSPLIRDAANLISEYHAMLDSGVSKPKAVDSMCLKLRGIVSSKFEESMDVQKVAFIKRAAVRNIFLPIVQDVIEREFREMI
jgi:hypothetical protein